MSSWQLSGRKSTYKNQMQCLSDLPPLERNPGTRKAKHYCRYSLPPSSFPFTGSWLPGLLPPKHPFQENQVPLNQGSPAPGLQTSSVRGLLGIGSHSRRGMSGEWVKLGWHYCLSASCLRQPPSMEKLSSMKLAPGAKKIGDCCPWAHELGGHAVWIWNFGSVLY